MDSKEINKINMEAINPKTIASLNVLKDESTTTIYDQKEKKSVDIITLKKE